ncbi:ATP-binding cassette domain-containing protein [Deefgea tanakiae]|uniref:ATP-binding cassette domain-containing protein n=1 Tax=Deefgea tanakiae TaxID=2865840 RepID=A0ABX8Z306_9NEIS|nr:ATP-binding cassette domain-containing protein [Deefgea tanakiae]QZA76957.1 ATP-binding cassette domain-containing protein [Deefgea tanakiae]
MNNLHLDIHTTMHSAQGAMPLQLKTEFSAGSITALSGDSGAGKSTVLHMIAGLKAPEHGEIRYGDTVWFAGKTNIPARQRSVGLVFQDYALFPNMSVHEQLSYAQHQRSPKKVDALLAQMGLSQLAERKPAQLSGGQQQRVALARALAAEPQILLLDEALSALDRQLRVELQQHLLDWQRESGAIVIVVSHDLGEIFRLATRVLKLEHGQLIAEGSPAEVLLPQRASGRLQLTGTLLAIESAGVAALVTIVCGNEIIATLVNPDEAKCYSIGQMVAVTLSGASAAVSKI